MASYRKGDMEEFINILPARAIGYSGAESNCYLFKKHVVLNKHSTWRIRQDIILRTKIAQKIGGRIARTLERDDKHIFMERAEGKPLYNILQPDASYASVLKSAAHAPPKHYDEFIKTVIIGLMTGLEIDVAPQNVLYHPKKGFSLVDVSCSGRLVSQKDIGEKPMWFAALIEARFCNPHKRDLGREREYAEVIKIRLNTACKRNLTHEKVEQYYEAAKVLHEAISKRSKLSQAVEIAKKAIRGTKEVNRGAVCKR